jgi:hypothetical protein
VSRGKLLFAALIAAWFCYFSWGSVSVRLAPDDMMNIWNAWHPPPSTFLVSPLLFWRNFVRPLGGFFYRPLFDRFGFDPAPYHWVLLAILAFNTYQVYRLARLLRAGEMAAGLAALVTSYHAGLAKLNYSIAFSYDVLCGCFYLAALRYYVGIREAGQRLRAHQIAIFLLLYLCALQSKEMAVTLPVIVLAYEWLYHGRKLAPAGIVAAGLLTLPYCFAKLLGGTGVWLHGSWDPYRPVFSFLRVVDFQCRSWGDMLLWFPRLNPFAVVAVWVAVLWIAFRRSNPLLQLCAVWVAVTPLPIEFLEARGDGCLYIPLVGLAMFSMTLLASRRSVAIVAVFVLLWGVANDHRKRTIVRPRMDELGVLTEDVLRQMQALHPTVPPHGSVVFLRDPFVEWDMAFIAELWLRDRTVKVTLARKTTVSADDLARADRIFDFQNGRLVQLR